MPLGDFVWGAMMSGFQIISMILTSCQTHSVHSTATVHKS